MGVHFLSLCFTATKQQLYMCIYKVYMYIQSIYIYFAGLLGAVEISIWGTLFSAWCVLGASEGGTFIITE